MTGTWNRQCVRQRRNLQRPTAAYDGNRKRLKPATNSGMSLEIT